MPRRNLDEDSAVAGALGIVLMLAVAMTAFGNAVRNDLPIYGEASERQWDADIASAFRQLGRATAQASDEGAPVAATFPAPPEPRSISIPLLGTAAPLKPSGSIRFDPNCARFTATHELIDGTVVNDLIDGSPGCLEFAATPVYSRAYSYRMEFGGLVRVQGDRAVVIAGPPLDVSAASANDHRIALDLPGLRGHATSLSNDATSVRADLVPGPSAREVEQATNARSATWTLDTKHASAWKTWFETRMAQAGLTSARPSPLPGESAADYTISCMPADCSAGASGLGRVIVTLHGPRTDVADIKLSFTYGLYDANLH